jgi:hypothetical protein
LVREQPFAAAAVGGAPPEGPASVSETTATSATTTTRRDRCKARRMAGTLAPRLRVGGCGYPGAAAGGGHAVTGAAGATSGSLGMTIHAAT